MARKLKLTKERRSAYIRGKGIQCPFCGLNCIAGGSVEIDGGVATQGVSCTECNREWTDVYRLVDIRCEDE